jgi:hypothetical protein
VLAAFADEIIAPIRDRLGANFGFAYDPEGMPPGSVPVVALSANRDGQRWGVSIWGSSTDVPALTRDGFAIALCHELGHHFGGTPYKLDERGRTRWSSTEGQADYYATAVCAKRMLARLPAPLTDLARLPLDVQAACAQHAPDVGTSLLCARAIVGARSYVASTLQGGRTAMPEWTAAGAGSVSLTLGVSPNPADGGYAYPDDDCRMQTLRQGAFCQALPRPTTLELLGLAGAERFCDGAETARPACWYAR